MSDFLFNTRLKRRHFWLVAMPIVFIGMFLVGGVSAWAGLSADEMQVVGYLYWIPTILWAFAARARDAGKGGGWIAAAFFIPVCWIVLGCFASAEADEKAELQETFA